MFAGLVQTAAAQDPHFSFFSSNPLAVNPALVGQINQYNSRVQLSHRRQWSTILGNGAFESAFASYEKRFCLPWRNNFVGVGASFLGDERGDFPMQRADMFGAASFILLLAQNSQSSVYLSAGVEGGWIFHRIGADQLTFDEQFDDPNLPPEVSALASNNTPDLGIGVAVSFAREQSSKVISGQFGLALKHITKPPLRFYQLDDELTPILEQHLVAHGALSVPLSRKLSIPIQIVYRSQKPHQQLLFSVGMQVATSGEWQFQLAGGVRHARGVNGLQQDALIPRLSVLHGKVQFTASYDVNTSPLRQASAAQGGMEVQLAYMFGAGKCQRVFCPGM